MIKELTTQEINVCSGGKEEKVVPGDGMGTSVGYAIVTYVTLMFAGNMETKREIIFAAVALPITMIASYKAWFIVSRNIFDYTRRALESHNVYQRSQYDKRINDTRN